MIELYRYRNFERLKVGLELWILDCGCREVQVHFGVACLRLNWHKCEGL